MPEHEVRRYVDDVTGEDVIDVPTLPWQAKFSEDPSERKVIIGGVGSGKSIICADWLIERAIEAPYARHYIIGASHPTMKEGTIPTFESRLVEYGCDYRLNKVDLSIVVTSGPAKGARFIAWTAEKYLRLKSQLLDSAWLDETQTWKGGSNAGSDAYDFIVNRMRPSEDAQKYHPWLQPALVMSANPPHTTAHWLYQYFVEEQKAKLFHVTTYDNWLLAPDKMRAYIERLRTTLSAAVFRIEVLGEWGDVGLSRAYDSFSRAKNVSEAFLGAPIGFDPDADLWWFHDFGVAPRVSTLGHIYRVDEPGFQAEVLVLFDEITNDEGGTSTQIAEFCNRYPAGVVKKKLRLCGDPAGQTRSSTTGESDWALLARDERLKPYDKVILRQSSAPLVVDRVNATNAKLCNAKGDVGIVMHPRMKKTTTDFQTTRFIEGTRELDHGSLAKGLIRTHWTDTVGYGVWHKWPLKLSSFSFGTGHAKPVRGRSLIPARR